MQDASQIQRFYNTFREISRIVHSSTEIDEVLELIVWKATEALNAKGCLLRLLNLDTEELELSAAYGLSQEYLAKGPVSQKKIITDLYKLNKVIIIKDLLHDERIQYPQEALKEGLQMVVDLPLRLSDHLAGILRIVFTVPREISEIEIDFAVSLAEQCACALDKARFIKTQRSRYDQLVLHTEKLSALGRMAAGIAHEINNPLAGILLYSSNLYKKASDKGPFKEGLEVIMRETQRCKIIIQDLLEFSRDKEPKKTWINIHDVIEKALSILENEFKLRHIKLEKHLAPEMKNNLLDENQLQQLFINLLLNAAQAIDKEGKITIQTRIDVPPKHIVIEIADTGCGIPTEHMGHIFEPFFSTKKNGSGLGLAVSSGIGHNHRGEIDIRSAPGRGARFIIKLPVQQGEPTS
ncbi:MAG: GAF domain-containing protein [Desulfobacterales bacterium]|nr:MAG: GAF domain-containing protein [Desulfobacterales bacterium]